MNNHKPLTRWIFVTLLLTETACPALLQAANKDAGSAAKPTAAVVASPGEIKLDHRALSRRIDTALEAPLRAEKVAVSPRSDDAEFARRLYLDLIGRIPPVEKVTAFLDSRDPDKRAKLIDELLASNDFGKHQADIWQALLLPRTSDNRFVAFDAMTTWLTEQFNKNTPWDKLVRDLLTATGEVEKNGAVTYFLANPTPDKLTDNATRNFLGLQLQCAQCHNHPFTGWKQNEYWGMAAFFTKVRFDGNPRQAAMGNGTVGVHEGGRGRALRLPESAKVLPPKFLQAEQPQINGERYLPVLADWMTSPGNPYFSKALVNRLWTQLFGRGIVNPVDDMHEGHPPSHPELLTDLAQQFAANHFDVKDLSRAICNSQAYQRTSKPAGNNADASPELFSHMAVKVMTPEQMFDSLTQVLGANREEGFRRRGPGGAAGRFRGNSPRTVFVTFFKGDDGADPTEYQNGIPQVLRLMNSPQLNNAGMLAPLLRNNTVPEKVVEHLFLATLSRRPNSAELDRTLALVRKYPNDAQKAYADILWALLNSSEFTLNH
jgi:hypothetical protein